MSVAAGARPAVTHGEERSILCTANSAKPASKLIARATGSAQICPLFKPQAKTSRLRPTMKHTVRICILGLGLVSTLGPQLSAVCAQVTAFTCQGRLNDGANSANSTYDRGFTIYDALSGAGDRWTPPTPGFTPQSTASLSRPTGSPRPAARPIPPPSRRRCRRGLNA